MEHLSTWRATRNCVGQKGPRASGALPRRRLRIQSHTAAALAGAWCAGTAPFAGRVCPTLCEGGSLLPSPRVFVLRAAGTNCDLETQHAWELAGATVERIHVLQLIERPTLLDHAQILTLPGGFSYGDDIAAGRILADQLERHLSDALHAFVDRGRLVLGICNGFQVLVQMGLLPFPPEPGHPRACTITANIPPGFQVRWVHLRAANDRCVFLDPGRHYEMPIAHGEGRVLCADENTWQRLQAGGHAPLLYTAAPHTSPGATAPANPNGSQGDIAGLCDATGRVFGLMPHPERFVDWTQHPAWTSQPERPAGDGLALFERAVRGVA